MQENETSTQWKQPSAGRSMAVGAGLSILLLFPLAALIAGLFRFPIPFAGYESGIDAMGRAFLAVFFYGVLGGFVIVAILGAVAGYIVHQKVWADAGEYWKRMWLLSAAAAGAPLLLLSVLDLLIGTW